MIQEENEECKTQIKKNSSQYILILVTSVLQGTIMFQIQANTRLMLLF